MKKQFKLFVMVFCLLILPVLSQAVTEQQVAELYVATFNRAPDSAGLDFWVNDSGFTIEQIAESFFDQTETQALYPPGTTETVFVTSIYSNLFNRVPDAAGLAYWVDALGSGAVTKPVMIEAVKNGAQGTDAEIVANKTEVGLYFTSMGLENNFSLSGITASETSVITAKAAIDLLIDNAPKIVQLIPISTNSISVAWLAATSPSVSEFTYEIHAGSEDNFAITPATLMQNVTGELQAEISGLSTGTKYYVLVVAVAQNGITLPGEKYWSITTNNIPMEFNPDVNLLNTEDANLGIPTVLNDEYVFQKSGSSELLEGGSIIVGENIEGGYLRKVESVTDAGDEIIVETSGGTLSEAVTAGRISSTVLLFSPDSSEAVSYSSKRSVKSDGSPYTRMEWKNKLLTVEETISPRLVPSNHQGYRSIGLIQRSALDNVSNQITLEASLEFEPSLSTDVQWHTEWLSPVIDSGEVIAIGTFRVDMSARYQFEAVYKWGTPEEPKEEILWERTWTSVYSAGSVPVYQEITFTLTSQAWANASAEIDSTAKAFAQTEIEVGVRYNPDTQKWEAVTGLDFDKGLTATLNAEGTLEGEVRLVPNIEIKFYKVVGANLSLEPYNHGLINYSLDASLSGPTIMQFNNFDYYVGLDCNMSLTLWPIFDDEDPLYSAQLYSKTWPVFDLPQLDLTSSQTGNTYYLTAVIDDGTNNAFVYDSIEWEVYDPNGDRTTLNGGAYDGFPTAEFVPDLEGPYTILMSGYGQLGEWVGEVARRYTTTEFEVNGITDTTTGFKVTASTYSETEDLNQVCIDEYGSKYSLADWNDLTNYISNNSSMTQLYQETGIDSGLYYVSYNGEQYYGSGRQYYIDYRDHVPPNGLVHDEIDNYLFYLGSWYGMDKQALCKCDDNDITGTYTTHDGQTVILYEDNTFFATEQNGDPDTGPYSVSGSTLTLTVTEPGYSVTLVGEISGNAISGTWSDSDGDSGAWSMTKN